MTAQPPRFVVDRCLGKVTPARLRNDGWDLVLITDVFPNDAQDVPDDMWLAWASENADGALTKDSSIRRMPWYQAAKIPIFSLGNQSLGIDTMVVLFNDHRERIAAVTLSHPGRQFWVINSNGDLRRTN